MSTTTVDRPRVTFYGGYEDAPLCLCGNTVEGGFFPGDDQGRAEPGRRTQTTFVCTDCGRVMTEAFDEAANERARATAAALAAALPEGDESDVLVPIEGSGYVVAQLSPCDLLRERHRAENDIEDLLPLASVTHRESMLDRVHRVREDILAAYPSARFVAGSTEAKHPALPIRITHPSVTMSTVVRGVPVTIGTLTFYPGRTTVRLLGSYRIVRPVASDADAVEQLVNAARKYL